eukprot:2151702-Pleurochrysis_carterae.AAC.3
MDIDRPVGLTRYSRLNRKSVVTSETAPLKSVPPTTGIVNTYLIMGDYLRANFYESVLRVLWY